MIDGNKVIIIRAENGWILEREKSNNFGEGAFTVQKVFEDGNCGLDGRLGRADSLSNLLWEAFAPQYQTNHSGGLSIEVKERGYGYERQISPQNPENRPNNGPDPLNVEKML